MSEAILGSKWPGAMDLDEGILPISPVLLWEFTMSPSGPPQRSRQSWAHGRHAPRCLTEQLSPPYPSCYGKSLCPSRSPSCKCSSERGVRVHVSFCSERRSAENARRARPSVISRSCARDGEDSKVKK